MSTTEFCVVCEAEREYRREQRIETYQVRGESIELPVEREVCPVCGTARSDEASDDAIVRSVYDEYRRRHGLLMPEEIRQIRERYDLSQQAFAALLGMSEATINRYEKGSVQEETHDNLIRFARRRRCMGDLVQRRGHKLSEAQLHNVLEALSKHARRPIELDTMAGAPIGASRYWSCFVSTTHFGRASEKWTSIGALGSVFRMKRLDERRVSRVSELQLGWAGPDGLIEVHVDEPAPGHQVERE